LLSKEVKKYISNNNEVVNWQLEKCLHLALRLNSLAIIKMLVEDFGADVNMHLNIFSLDEYGWDKNNLNVLPSKQMVWYYDRGQRIRKLPEQASALWYMAHAFAIKNYKFNPEIFNYLIANGADLKQEFANKNALEIALATNHQHAGVLAKCLISKRKYPR
jgi:hypothetical protein